MHCIGCFRYEFGVLCCYDTKYFQSMFVSFVLLCFVRNGVNKKRLEGCDSGVFHLIESYITDPPVLM